ncbi:MAG: hypothetical protein ACI31V_05955 [Bacilli bacterium]
MSKVSIETSLKKNNNEELNIKTLGILQEEQIKYKESEIISIFDINKETLKRKSNDYDLTIDFKNEIIKTEYINIKIRIIDKQIEQNKIKIKYEVIDTKDIFEYEIIWREL